MHPLTSYGNDGRGMPCNGCSFLRGHTHAWDRMPMKRPERKENVMEWIAPDFEEYELESEVTAYAGHW